MTITRRDLLAGSAAFATIASFPARVLGAPLPRDIDVAVIGAGAAGIAAARRIAAAGRKVIVIEAGAAAGGRCLTDRKTFETPFERGARWLYTPESNSVAKLARGAGVDLYPAPRGQRIRIGRRNARAGETEDFLSLLVRANRAIGDAVRGRADMPAAAALPKDLREWTGTMNFLLGPFATGKDLGDLSAADLMTEQMRDPASACRQGLGVLLAKLGESVPMALATPVTRIVWGTRDVQIETGSGNLTARAAILTASTNVIASGKIKFTPDLPKRQLDALAKLTLGSYDRIALELTGNPLGLAHNEAFIEQSNDNRTGLLLANAGGSSLCQIDVAGSFGRDLSAQGEAAMTAFAVEWLTKLFGGDVVKAVKKSSATRWNDAPYIMGAMSAAAPGGQPSRKILMEPLGNLFLAGEAAHETQWGTVDGAWESGERAADAVLRKISGVKEPAASRKAKPSRRTPRAAPRGAGELARPRR